MLRAAGGGGGIPTYTWATKPASALNGALAFVSDAGDAGAYFSYSTALVRWVPFGGEITLKSVGAVSGVTNTETIVAQTQIPIGLWQANDTARIWFTPTKSGATDNYLVTVRVGTAGTTGDTAITGLSSFQLAGGTMRASGHILDVKLLTNTSASKVGTNQANSSSYGGSAVGTAANTATVITDASANALWFSLSIASSSTTDTVGISDARIRLVR